MFKKGDLIRTDVKKWSYKVWTGVVLQVMSDGEWLYVRMTEPDGPNGGSYKEWVPTHVCKVVK